MSSNNTEARTELEAELDNIETTTIKGAASSQTPSDNTVSSTPKSGVTPELQDDTELRETAISPTNQPNRGANGGDGDGCLRFSTAAGTLFVILAAACMF